MSNRNQARKSEQVLKTVVIPNTVVRKQYCIKHSATVLVFYPEEFGGLGYHRLENQPVPVLEGLMCFGEFTECPPPEMTEEEWNHLLNQGEE